MHVDARWAAPARQPRTAHTCLVLPAAARKSLQPLSMCRAICSSSVRDPAGGITCRLHSGHDIVRRCKARHDCGSAKDGANVAGVNVCAAVCGWGAVLGAGCEAAPRACGGQQVQLVAARDAAVPAQGHQVSLVVRGHAAEMWQEASRVTASRKVLASGVSAAGTICARRHIPRMAEHSKQATLLLAKQLQGQHARPLRRGASPSAELAKHPVEGFSAGLIDEGDMFKWDIMILGPPDTF